MATNPGQDYVERVREEAATLESELQVDQVRTRLANAARVLGISEPNAVAAIYRAARRSGLTVAQFLAGLESALSPHKP